MALVFIPLSSAVISWGGLGQGPSWSDLKCHSRTGCWLQSLPDYGSPGGQGGRLESEN